MNLVKFFNIIHNNHFLIFLLNHLNHFSGKININVVGLHMMPFPIVYFVVKVFSLKDNMFTQGLESELMFIKKLLNIKKTRILQYVQMLIYVLQKTKV